MVSRLVPKFEASTLTIHDFRWVHQEVWGEAETSYYYAHWPAPITGMDRHPVFVRTQHHRQRLVLMGRWILLKGKSEAVATAEVEALLSSFTQVYVHLGSCSGQAAWSDASYAEALALFISGVLMMAKGDLLRLMPTCAQVESQLGKLGWGEKVSLWSPDLAYLDGLSTPTPARTSVIRSIDPEVWWISEVGQSSRRALSYLEKRMSLSRLKEKSWTPKRAGLFGRLGKFIRWS